jgi:hypothetical protein
MAVCCILHIGLKKGGRFLVSVRLIKRGAEQYSIVDCTISAQGGGVCVDKISFFYQLV